jgi:hydrogenase maturation protease
VLIGVQPEELKDYGGSLRPVIRAQVSPSVDIAAEWLRRWGIDVEPRQDPASASVNAGALALEAYEGGRPSEVDACRIGDPRFMTRRNS